MLLFRNLLLVFSLIVLLVGESASAQTVGTWETVTTEGQPTARHEASLVAYKGKLYLIGGRRINPVNVYDPLTNSWTAKSKTPIELHHFQAVVHGDAIYMIGAMTGGWPNETPLEKVVVYYPEKDEFKFIHTIPKSRRRGGAGSVVYGDQIYIVGGITNGHMDGYQPWLDRYDPKTGQWTPLKDAPHARDHFSVAVIDNRLYAAAGRTTSQRTKQGFDLTVSEVDVYDFEQKRWIDTEDVSPIPTPRAGNMTIASNGKLIIGGGESGSQNKAHNEVEAFDPKTSSWSKLPSLQQGRHGSGFAVIGNFLYTASGCGNRGGSPELSTLERIRLSPQHANNAAVDVLRTKTLSFAGPETSETATPNPFTDYRLDVTFTHPASEKQIAVRGFYAADGDAANSSANSGNVWQARFSPDEPGEWTYSATLRSGPQIAISSDSDSGTRIEIANPKGSFRVHDTGNEAPEFFRSSRGRIVVRDQYFRFAKNNEPWLKGGTDSPENLLAYEDFDGTYRMQASAEEGEAKTDKQIHRFEPHAEDWKQGDPAWAGADGGEPRGKALIGGLNYLNSQGINSAYFLTMNINGDGKDVWPYASPDDFTRFDCSKLDQWEIVFAHMQSLGILLHFQTQETENETLLDDGDTGPLRKLYYQELIARFGHHPALIWNLGEEFGPADWTPVGQTSKQAIAMADYFQANDPYDHPLVIHTHADSHSKDKLLTPLLGVKSIDGLSFQVDKPNRVHTEIKRWFELSEKAGHRWLISMDEIGPWMHGVITDDEDPDHDDIRHHVLWGGLMAGCAGVEWYFGAHHPHTDLSAEDWRSRENMWQQTTIARTFFQQHLPYDQMKSADELIVSGDGYCLAKGGEVYAVYLKTAQSSVIDLSSEQGNWSVRWFNAKSGGELKQGSNSSPQPASEQFSLGTPPFKDVDCLAIVRKAKE